MGRQFLEESIEKSPLKSSVLKYNVATIIKLFFKRLYLQENTFLDSGKFSNITSCVEERSRERTTSC